jgi:hypothetical protein
VYLAKFAALWASPTKLFAPSTGPVVEDFAFALTKKYESADSDLPIELSAALNNLAPKIFSSKK